MAWAIEYHKDTRKQIAQLDRVTQKRIKRFLEGLQSEAAHPRSRGKPLTADLAGLWCYRCGDYRILCEVRDDRLLILVIRIGHRSVVYRH